MHYNSNMIRVKNSRIHGIGVFATREIRKGTRIFKYEGAVISEEKAIRLEFQGKDDYLFDLENGTFVDGDLSKPCTRINHSCDPNCYVEFENGEIIFYAAKRIKKNAELTFDYAFDPEYEHTPCGCNSRNCRGVINEIDED